ncbi:MAG: methyltransferase type 11 [Mucilaginibacter sp.]
MVEVFKTNIRYKGQTKPVIKKLEENFPGSCVNFDLQDCDNILRVEGDGICPIRIIDLVIADGYECEVLI